MQITIIILYLRIRHLIFYLPPYTKFHHNSSNHVDIYVSVPPYQSISKVVQYLKGKTSRKIQQEFPELRKRYWGKHLWAVGYFVRTAGNVTEQMIKDYIDRHESRDDKFGDFQVEN